MPETSRGLSRWLVGRQHNYAVAARAFSFELLDDLHLLLRARWIFQARVKEREIVVGRGFLRVEFDSGLELFFRAIVVAQLDVTRAQSDARIGVVRELLHGFLKQRD